MIRLELTLSEAEQLQQWLSAEVESPTSQMGDSQSQAILERLTAAYDSALLEQTCPVCQRTFTQEKRGRTGQYCSNACKQKAYRQRRHSWFRHYGPSHRS